MLHVCLTLALLGLATAQPNPKTWPDLTKEHTTVLAQLEAALNDPRGGKETILALFAPNVTYCQPYPSMCANGMANASKLLDVIYGAGLTDIRAWKQGYPLMANSYYGGSNFFMIAISWGQCSMAAPAYATWKLDEDSRIIMFGWQYDMVYWNQKLRLCTGNDVPLPNEKATAILKKNMQVFNDGPMKYPSQLPTAPDLSNVTEWCDPYPRCFYGADAHQFGDNATKIIFDIITYNVGPVGITSDYSVIANTIVAGGWRANIIPGVAEGCLSALPSFLSLYFYTDAEGMPTTKIKTIHWHYSYLYFLPNHCQPTDDDQKVKALP